MSRRPVAVLFAAMAVLVSTAGISAANGAEPDPNAPYQYRSIAGGTQVKVLGGAIRSDLTSQSAVTGTTYPAAHSNTLASVDVEHVLHVGAISTSTDASKVGTTTTTTSAGGKTVDISLLDGVIKAEALDTRATATRTGTELAGDTATKFVRLTIAGQTLPIDIPKNFQVNVPGVASVTVNESKTVVNGATVTASGSALKVTLLGAYGEAPAGSTIAVNPVSATLAPAPPTNVTKVGGYGYGTYVAAQAGSGVKVVSGPTAFSAVPPTGTGGYTVTNSTLAADVPKILSVGVIETTNNATSVPVTADVTNTNQTARVNLLNGLITADVIKVTAHAKKGTSAAVTSDANMKLVNLKVAGLAIPLTVGPNTTINVPLVAKVVINEQVKTSKGITIMGIHVTLLGATQGLPAGADIQVAVANSTIG